MSKVLKWIWKQVSEEFLEDFVLPFLIIYALFRMVFWKDEEDKPRHIQFEVEEDLGEENEEVQQQMDADDEAS